MEICKYYCNFKHIKFLTSIKSKYDHEIEIEHIQSKTHYSKFILKNIINYIDTDYVLIVQHDGFILNPSSWSDEFYNCDYIGAKIRSPSVSWKNKSLLVGNGGFSMRSTKLVEYISKTCNMITKLEDNYICNVRYDDLCKNGFYIPNDNISLVDKFGIEGRRNTWTNSFGHHNANLKNWHTPL
jgi:hypothetical protein